MINIECKTTNSEYKKVRVAIAGATGYTGAELVKLIVGHPYCELVAVTSRSYAGESLENIFPSLRNIVNIKCEEMKPENLFGRVDCIFLALPHKISMQYAPIFLENNIKVIDLSADFRFKNLAAYQETYQKHSCPELLKHAVYGLSEIYKDEIAGTKQTEIGGKSAREKFDIAKSANLIGNPGCYPTSFLLPTIPLISEGVIKKEGIISDSKSGVSGAGRSLSLTSHYCEVAESFKPYKVGNHRHVPEMEEILSYHARLSNQANLTVHNANDSAILSNNAEEKIKITFVPHLLPMSRGMLTTIYAEISDEFKKSCSCNGKDISIHENILKIFERYYKDKFFVRVLPKGKFPDTAHVRGTNFCDIGFWVDDKSSRVIIVSAIDNILKGASGQAVQNMNIMFGIDEKAGLQLIPGAI
ncbi:MAG: N-acetyl-gamma-glutamyl-phosphate reductase [Desulfamplus sp.]|nr:N-acetyl-gamma-glutamyl-phosphate reductase [Desulfamplus sp.]